MTSPDLATMTTEQLRARRAECSQKIDAINQEITAIDAVILKRRAQDAKEVRAEIKARAEAREKEVREEMTALAAARGLTLEDVFPDAARPASATKPGKRTQPAAKYWNPATGETWVGRGPKPPKWARDLIRASTGKDWDEMDQAEREVAKANLPKA